MMMATEQVLDHGYVKLIEWYGSDESIIEAARMSTAKGFLGWGVDKEHPGDEKLLSFLYNNKHSTPFEMAGMIIEVKAPIFVFREWHRHRTQSYNEMSARYIPLPDENYIPTVERFLRNSTANKQAQSIGKQLDTLGASIAIKELNSAYKTAQEIYVKLLEEGTPKELARLILPVGRYSRMRASANLRNWLAFLTLRAAPNAQWEIQEYARAVAELIKEKFPRTYELWNIEQQKGQ